MKPKEKSMIASYLLQIVNLYIMAFFSYVPFKYVKVMYYIQSDITFTYAEFKNIKELKLVPGMTISGREALSRLFKGPYGRSIYTLTQMTGVDYAS